MSAASLIVSWATVVALVVLSLSFLLTVYRVIKGPTLPDRIIALDMLVGIVIGFIAVIAIKTGFTLYIDIAIALGLVGFLATVAFARFVLSRASSHNAVAAKAATQHQKPQRKKAPKRKK
jgi:multicomponent Na+:H+ antiporter subunit F